MATADDFLRWELALARRDPTGIQAGLESLLSADFLEFGSSGRCWDRAAIIRGISVPTGAAITVDDFAATPLNEGVVLVTYRMTEVPPGETPRVRLRASVWCFTDGRWTMRFHQGTPVEGGDASRVAQEDADRRLRLLARLEREGKLPREG